MSESEYPRDRYQAFPHIRLSKSQYLVVDENQVYLVNLLKDHSVFSCIIHQNEIQKCTIEMQIRHKYPNNLFFRIVSKSDVTYAYRIDRRKNPRYSSEDWQSIPNFLRSMELRRDPFLLKEYGLDNVTRCVDFDIYPYQFFPKNDKIFQLRKDFDFCIDMKSIRSSIDLFPQIFLLVGIVGIGGAFVFGLDNYLRNMIFFWICAIISPIFIGIAICAIINQSKKKKKISEKYDIAYYF